MRPIFILICLAISFGIGFLVANPTGLGCSAKLPSGISFHANSAKSNVGVVGDTGPMDQNGGCGAIMPGVNLTPGEKIRMPGGSNLFAYYDCIGGPTGVGSLKWTDFKKWDPQERRNIERRASKCKIENVFGTGSAKWLGSEGLGCVVKEMIEYAKLNSHIRVHLECDNMTYIKESIAGGEVGAYNFLVDEIRKAGICNLAIVPKNLSDDDFTRVAALDSRIISNIGARETKDRNPPRQIMVGRLLVAQNPDAETGNYRLNARGGGNCEAVPVAREPALAPIVNVSNGGRR